MSPTREKAQLMSASEIDRTLVRLAHEILERSRDIDRLVFIGIRRRGVPLRPVVNATDIPFEVAGKDVILMDDVLYTGRTIRAALDALFDQGRAARVQLLVLIDRGHRELPVEAQYIGRTVQTADHEIIEVKFQEIDNMEKVLLVEKVA